jgi:hypothetical protein
MTFKPALWKPIAFVLGAVNLVAVGFAAGAAEPYHAAGHAALALAFGLWAQRLGQSPRGIEGPARLEELEADMSDMRRELSEVQERLDFAERVLSQRPESRQVGPEH